MFDTSVHFYSEVTFYYSLSGNLINADGCVEEVRLLQSLLMTDSGCKEYQTQKEKEFEILTRASDSSIPVSLQAVKSDVTVNNYCHNISNQQTQTAWKLLLSKYLTCEIL